MIPLPTATAPTAELRVKSYTFGCKVNKADTVLLEHQLAERAAGRPALPGETPDLVLVNTCTVTAEADRQARQLIRRLHRELPSARIVVTGCYAEAKPDELRDLSGVSAVIPLHDQNQLLPVLGLPSLPTDSDRPLVRFSTQTRAYLKMQEGCNAYCSFCILPHIRGRSRSLPLSELVKQAARFEESGYRELVLTGTHIGAYGRDLHPRMKFSEAVTALLEGTQEIAIRISSLEPTTLTADLIRLVGRETRIRPHMHIPLQSGSEKVLRAMNRKYFVRNFIERIRDLAEARSEVAIGTDVIVGFPGEEEADFNTTVQVIEDLPISYLHVFPYSPRPGTRAETYSDSVPWNEKKARVRALRAKGEQFRDRFYRQFLGREVSVLVERKRDRRGRLTGYTPHYVPVRLNGPDSWMGQPVQVELLDVEQDVVVGKAVEHG